ncbi:alkaline phosphatase family protein [Grosmannia clavigera kw1407]|uniref:Alkaline phosphatase family protein n=1 Tax=Grosmannia clavigera (strain kw1407 / UAMH 11150) TaxID=655863 RepID=F0XD13_GROCL|nr:alkaline phosphatase family protein [Grosmannia clavigera kw1407]EFX03544.1 alkaline phosphatase family protein [Grosmannia clavigera kw1407]
MAVQTALAQITSILIRILSYFFLRWVSAPIVPPVIFSLLAVNVPAFIFSHWAEPKYEVVGEEIDIIVTDTEVTNENGDGSEMGEVNVSDTVILGRRSISPWRSLLLGAPSPSKLLSLLAVAINVALVAMVADRLFSEHSVTAADLSFVRPGYISDTQAKFVIREPDQSKMPVSMQIRIKDAQPPFDSPVWQTVGGTRWTDNSTDYTVVLTVPLQNPVQRIYEWKTSNNHSGEFMAGPKAGKAPALFNGSFTFVTTSCVLSRVPYSPLDHPLAIPGLRYLANVLPKLNAQFMLFLGDFIYSDVPRYWGKSVEDYRQKYRQVYASPDWKAVGQNLSWIHVLDDHEIKNDWSENSTGVYEAAVDPWHHYHTGANPPAARQAGTQSLRPGATYFEFAQGPASFFMLDTRSYRSSNSLPFNSTDKSMLGAEQLADLLDYLRRPEPRGIKWKIVASSVPFTKNWRINRRDTWGGFLSERQVIFEAMWDAGLRGTGVVILSGDRHEFAATQFPPPANSQWPASVAVHEFSASPLSQFYSPVPSYFQWDDEDVKLEYIHRGNSKFGAVTINQTIGESDQSNLHYRLFIDGAETWNTTIVSPVAVIEEPKSSSIWNKILGR